MTELQTIGLYVYKNFDKGIVDNYEILYGRSLLSVDHVTFTSNNCEAEKKEEMCFSFLSPS